MRKIDRTRVPPPAYLSSRSAQQARQQFLDYLRLDPAQRAQTRVPDRHLPEDASISRALNELFLGKCAFCESAVRTTAYRFRPTSDAEPHEPSNPMAHLLYGWLADAWQNIYPICYECRPRQRNLFPVWKKRLSMPTPEEYAAYVASGDGLWPSYPLKENPKLIDPGGPKDLREHFRPQSSGRILPHSEDAVFTIEHFNLNRENLVERRRQAFAAYDALSAPPPADAEFVGLWDLLVRQRQEAVGPLDVSAPEVAVSSTPAPPPRLVRVEVENFKALEKLELILPFDPAAKLAQATLILGENATGKSSILEAIALCLMGDKAREKLAEPPGKYLLDPRLMGQPDAQPRGTTRVDLIFEGGGRRTLTITAEGFTTTGIDPRQPVYAYGAYRHYLDKRRNWSPERPVVSLFRSDNLLSNPQDWLLGLDDRHFEDVVRALREIFGAAESFSVIERDPATATCFVVSDLRDGRRARTPLSSVSSGFRTILALTCDVMRWAMDRRNDAGFRSLFSARGIVLIDEVEAHLHPRWKIQIMAGLRRALPGMTFVVTTHDPLCLRGMGQGEVKVLQRVPGEASHTSLPVQVETLTDLPDVATLTVEQLLTSDLFGLYSADDPETEKRLARLADYLAGEKRNEPDVQAAWRALRDEIGRALPIGLGEAGRLVHEVVAQYLVDRRHLPDAARRALRAETRRRIRERLEQM